MHLLIIIRHSKKTDFYAFLEKLDICWMLDSTCGQFTLIKNYRQFRIYFAITIRPKEVGSLTLLCFIS